MKKYITKSEKETRALGKKFAKDLAGGEMIELVGNLGSGKTTFVRGVVEGLGSTARVKSPTFTLMNEYPIDHPQIKKVVHLDFYRLEDPVQLEALAISDYQRDDIIIFVEWPDIFGTPAVTPTHKVNLTFVNENTREIEF